MVLHVPYAYQPDKTPSTTMHVCLSVFRAVSQRFSLCGGGKPFRANVCSSKGWKFQTAEKIR